MEVSASRPRLCYATLIKLHKLSYLSHVDHRSSLFFSFSFSVRLDTVSYSTYNLPSVYGLPVEYSVDILWIFRYCTGLGSPLNGGVIGHLN